MNALRIEKLIDPNTNLVAAAEQTRQPWVSVWCGPWAVIGTNDIGEAREFVREFLAAGPALGDSATMGATAVPDWTAR